MTRSTFRTVGEIVVRGPQLMRGYWKQAAATAEALRGGWLHTGDASRLDADSYLYIQDRVKDMIISGGENVYPREVEIALEGRPAATGARRVLKRGCPLRAQKKKGVAGGVGHSPTPPAIPSYASTTPLMPVPPFETHAMVSVARGETR